jgi:hypothetical protein
VKFVGCYSQVAVDCAKEGVVQALGPEQPHLPWTQWLCPGWVQSLSFAHSQRCVVELHVDTPETVHWMLAEQVQTLLVHALPFPMHSAVPAHPGSHTWRLLQWPVDAPQTSTVAPASPPSAEAPKCLRVSVSPPRKVHPNKSSGFGAQRPYPPASTQTSPGVVQFTSLVHAMFHELASAAQSPSVSQFSTCFSQRWRTG